MTNEKSAEKIGGIAASAVWLLFSGGLVAFALSIVSAILSDFVGAGVCLAGAALAHGLLLNALLRR